MAKEKSNAVVPKSENTSGAKSKPKVSKSAIGAPSQRSQPSRKGKRAWRKNVDLDNVEEGLEEIRTQERVLGKSLQATADSDLFQIDTEGDDNIRKSLTKFSSQLTSAKILARRSAVPAVYSRANSTNSASKRRAVSQADKDRLLRQAKKPRKGPFGAVIDEQDDQWGGARTTGLSEAVTNSGQYDPWSSTSAPEKKVLPDDFGIESVEKPAPKPPKNTLPDPRKHIQLSAVPVPHAGMSYNPPVNAHQELLLQAHSIEEKRVKELEKTKEIKERMERSRALEEIGADGDVPPGMTVDEPREADEEQEPSEAITKNMPQRKTKAQRRKAAKILEEKRILAERAAKKRMYSILSSTSSKLLRKSSLPSTQEVEERRRRLLESKLKNGLSGRRIGKHKVPEGQIDVQLGEELSESLRGLKVEGNLFRDRFLNLQQRALIEPRTLVLPKKRNKHIEYEKHAWKRFDKVQEKL
ncbi:hypothetical protein WG66_013501 [Moniliophthora roreri]|uniref:Ribosome biogenesis protein NOP53 n=1 Tax=Moniliophthora roreri TaxID=221103 RepID=A0A0W0FJE6_MONRR|nr:hypothetical protein WG66_013501 [Moniliophthora roreri]